MSPYPSSHLFLEVIDEGVDDSGIGDHDDGDGVCRGGKERAEDLPDTVCVCVCVYR